MTVNGRPSYHAYIVLNGTKPGDIPFYQQTRFELVLTRTTARTFGLEFPATLVALADEVIE